MALRERFIYAVDFLTDGIDTGLNRVTKGIKDAEGSVNKLKAAWSGAMAEFRGNRMAQAAVGVAAVGAAKVAIQAASDLEESVNAVTVTFGEASDAVLALGSDSARSFGLAQSEFNAFAVQFSSFAQTIATREGRAVADVIAEITNRTADFASVQNLDLNEAARVFMSTMAGETESIRRYGKDISAVAVEQYALANGLVASKNEMTEAIKVQARYGLLMEATADTANDFANTSDSHANATRIAKAQMKDLAAELGSRLVPATAAATSGLTDLLDVMEQLKLVGAAGFVQEWLTPLSAYNRAQEASVQATVLQIDSLDQLIGKTSEFVAELERRGFSEERITEIARDHGMALDEVGQAARGRAAPGLERLRKEEEALARETSAATREFDRQADAQRRAAGATRDQVAAVEDLIGAQARLLGGELGVEDAQQRAIEALREYEEAAANGARSAERLLSLQQQVVNAERGSEAADRAVEDARRAAAEADRAVSDAKQRDAGEGEIADLQERARVAREGVYGAEDRARDASKAIDEARRRVAEEERKSSPEELAALQRRATQAQLDAARAAAQYEVDLRAANGETVTAADETRLLRDALGEVATVLGPSSPLSQGLDGYIGLLDNAIAREGELTAAIEARHQRLYELNLKRFNELQEQGDGRFQAPSAVRGNTAASTPAHVTNVTNNTYHLAVKQDAREAYELQRDYEQMNGRRQ